MSSSYAIIIQNMIMPRCLSISKVRLQRTFQDLKIMPYPICSGPKNKVSKPLVMNLQTDKKKCILINDEFSWTGNINTIHDTYHSYAYTLCTFYLDTQVVSSKWNSEKPINCSECLIFQEKVNKFNVETMSYELGPYFGLAKPLEHVLKMSKYSFMW